MTFGEFIKAQRLSMSYSSTQLGGLVGCSASFITGIERGAQFPSTKMATKILDTLNVQYVEIDSLTLEIKNGPIFKFKSSLRGRNKEPRELLNKKDLEDRLFVLEDRVASLETLVVRLLSKNKEG